jgi:hypothetical protein
VRFLLLVFITSCTAQQTEVEVRCELICKKCEEVYVKCSRDKEHDTTTIEG